MGKFMKPGRAVLVLSGHYSGQKAIIMKNTGDSTSDHPYIHALVAAIDHYPQKVTANRSKIYNHLKSTRSSM
ncbi:60S ribosomal protein L27 [Microtus ochrogaster]|uniref:60S ribosomal protein L27 n=1 Tax=Microtus ochrogaster TaxID=79684 RepID=A0A8J6KZN1_MICOH|nr:60S ribosomal protein L27 [Microtus ochrogaster]